MGINRKIVVINVNKNLTPPFRSLDPLLHLFENIKRKFNYLGTLIHCIYI